MKKFSVLILIALMVLLLCSCKSKEAKAVDDLIMSIGDVTIDSKTEIEAARKAYDALNDKQKKQVENLTVLENAEKSLPVRVYLTPSNVNEYLTIYKEIVGGELITEPGRWPAKDSHKGEGTFGIRATKRVNAVFEDVKLEIKMYLCAGLSNKYWDFIAEGSTEDDGTPCCIVEMIVSYDGEGYVAKEAVGYAVDTNLYISDTFWDLEHEFISEFEITDVSGSAVVKNT